MRLTCLPVAAGLLVLGACGGGGDGGTTEPPPPPPPGGQQTLGSITTNVTQISIGAGTTQTITATAYNTQNQVISNATNFTYSSASPAIAEVDATGQVLAVSAGSTQITVSLTYNGVTRTANVAVSVTGSLPSSTDVTASSTDYVFTPRTVAITRNGSVTWTFGVLEHTVTFLSSSGAPASITNGYLRSETRTFVNAGNYSYTCTIHAGMNGTVIVR